MPRSPCCISKEGLDRVAWTPEEDMILSGYIGIHGHGVWMDLPQKRGLKRSGKSCRLRWLNYLRPEIKRGNISPDEEELVIRMNRLLGNRWSLIAGRLPGRTGNEIKNHWKSHLSKKKPINESQRKKLPMNKSERQKKNLKRRSTSMLFFFGDALYLLTIDLTGKDLRDSLQRLSRFPVLH